MLGGLMGILGTPLMSPRGATLAASALGYGVGHEAIRAQGDALRAYHGEAQYESQYAKGIGMAHAGVTIGALYGGASAIWGRGLGARTGGNKAAAAKRYATRGFMPLGTAGAANLISKGASGIARGAQGAWAGSKGAWAGAKAGAVGKTMTGLLSAPKNFRSAMQINRNALRPRQRDLASFRSLSSPRARGRPLTRNERRQAMSIELKNRRSPKGGTLQERYAAEEARIQGGVGIAQGKYDKARQTFGGGLYHAMTGAPGAMGGALAGGARAVAGGARYVGGGIAAGARRGALGGAIFGQGVGAAARRGGGVEGLAGRALPAAGYLAGGLAGGAAAPMAMAFRGAGRGLATGARAGGRGLSAGGRGIAAGAQGAWGKVGSMSMPDIPWSKMDPANWSKSTMIGGGFGMLGVGAVAGALASEGQYHFPIMEAGNVSLAPSTTQRMNYSTVGLTQALHDKTRRQF